MPLPTVLMECSLLSVRVKSLFAYHLLVVGCACAPVSLPRLCGARSASYCCVYPKTVRRTVVLCRGGPRGRPPPGNHKGCPYGCTSAFGLRMVAGMNFSVASPYAQIYRRHGTTENFSLFIIFPSPTQQSGNFAAE